MSSKKGRYEIWQSDKDQQWYFNRIAGNHEVEHPSQGYSTRGNAIAAIGRCMEDTSHYEIVNRVDSDSENDSDATATNVFYESLGVSDE